MVDCMVEALQKRPTTQPTMRRVSPLGLGSLDPNLPSTQNPPTPVRASSNPYLYLDKGCGVSNLRRTSA